MKSDYARISGVSTKRSPIIRVIRLRGGVSALARDLGVTKQVVWNWQKRGVPAEYVLTLVDLVDHQVSAKQLRPDVFGRKRK